MGAGQLERCVIIGLAGHIDHGKTTLVRALTGVDTDRLPEEKRRGITTDLGFAPLRLRDDAIAGVIDVPGHEALVHTMVAGATGISLALLVVAADQGVMPQTREHAQILSLLGVRQGVVALTRCDLVDEDWLQLMQEHVTEELASSTVEWLRVVPVSAVTGRGLQDLTESLRCAWGTAAPAQHEQDLFRMPIDRAFTIRGTGTVVTGTVWSGALERDQMLTIHPARRKVRVRGLQVHGVDRDCVAAGERAAIALAGCTVEQARRGSSLVSEEWHRTRVLDVTLVLTASGFKLLRTTRLRLHLGTAAVEARLSSFNGDASDVHRVILSEPIVARGGDRFILRLPAPLGTVGGGVVVDAVPDARVSLRRVHPARSAARGDLARVAAAAVIRAAGASGVELSTIPQRFGVIPADLERFTSSAGATQVGSRAYSTEFIALASSRLLAALEAQLRANPLAAGVPLESLRSAVSLEQTLCDHVVSNLMSARTIQRSGAVIRPAGWTAEMTQEQAMLADAVLERLTDVGEEPPSVAELAREFGNGSHALLRHLETKGDVVRVCSDRYYAGTAVKELVGRLRSSMVPGRTYTPAELRDVLGMSRKFLIPFLEYCDSQRVTKRDGNTRTIVFERVETFA